MVRQINTPSVARIVVWALLAAVAVAVAVAVGFGVRLGRSSSCACSLVSSPSPGRKITELCQGVFRNRFCNCVLLMGRRRHGIRIQASIEQRYMHVCILLGTALSWLGQ